MNFREMRRKKQLLGEEDCLEILQNNSFGVLSVLGEGGYPYGVPLSYVYWNGKIYFHCAKTGHKLQAIQTYSKASFCVVDQDLVVPQEYTTYFRSVILFGRMERIEDRDELHQAISLLAAKYAPEDCWENRNQVIEKEITALCMLRMDIEHMTGKEAIELVRAREET